MLNDRDRIKQLAEQILKSNTDSLDVLDHLLKAEMVLKNEISLDVEKKLTRG